MLKQSALKSLDSSKRVEEVMALQVPLACGHTDFPFAYVGGRFMLYFHRKSRLSIMDKFGCS